MRKIIRMFATGDLRDVASVIDSNYTDHQGLQGGGIHGKEGFCRVVKAARSAFSGLSVDTKDLIAESDKVAARLLWHSKEALGRGGTLLLPP